MQKLTRDGLTSFPAVAVQTFNEMIERKMRESPVQGLIVYPEGTALALTSNIIVGKLLALWDQNTQVVSEPRHGQAASDRVSAGHRSTRRDSLPLKRGMLHYCYDRNKTVQVGKLAERKAAVRSGVPLSWRKSQDVKHCSWSIGRAPAQTNPELQWLLG